MVEAESKRQSAAERIASSWAIVAAVARSCRWTFVAAMIADTCESVAAMVANSLPLPLPLPVPSQALVAARAASNSAASAASA